MYKKIIIVVLLLISGCTPKEKFDQDNIKSLAIVAIAASSINSINDKPNVNPDLTSRCITCDGTGKVGDGRVFATCLDCNGTGKIEPKNKLEVKELPKQSENLMKITMYSESWCLPCEKWKNDPVYMKEFLDAGFSIKHLSFQDLPSNIKTIPYFIVEYNGKSQGFSGFITLKYIREYFKNAK